MPGGMGQHCKTSPGALMPGLDPCSQGSLSLPPRALPEPLLGLRVPCPVSCVPCQCTADLNSHGSGDRGCANCLCPPPALPMLPPGLLCGTSCIQAEASRDGSPG